jgi:acetyl-CoA C-acetyltransferase
MPGLPPPMSTRSCSAFQRGFSAQDFTASLVLQASPDLRFKRASRVENACATGSARGASGHQSDRRWDRAHRARGRCRADDDNARGGHRAQPAQGVLRARGGGYRRRLCRDLRPDRGGYFQRWGDQSDALARIAAKNHPQWRGQSLCPDPQGLGLRVLPTESEKRTRASAGPLKRTDCSLVSDGAAGRRPRRRRTALKLGKAVAFRAAEHVQDFLADVEARRAQARRLRRAWKRALASAGMALSDLSFVETHDCFTIAELMEYEAMGLVPEGQGARAIAEGLTEKNGRLPVNPSGGLKAKGHPIGATGVSMHAVTAMQLTGTAGDMQVGNASLGGIFNMGGTAVANYVSILERIR